MNVTFDLLKKAQGEKFKNHSVVVGDFNFHSTTKKEEEILTNNGFRDVMHDFFDNKEPTMLKSKKFRAWRPDKVVIQAGQEEGRPSWKAVGGKIVGKDALPSFKAKGEDPTLVAIDGVIRTPSDHFGVFVDLCFK